MNDWVNGHRHKKDAHEAQQLLTKPQESALHDWIEFRALVAKPFDKRGIESLAFEMSGKVPNHTRQWALSLSSLTKSSSICPYIRKSSSNPVSLASSYMASVSRGQWTFTCTVE